MTIKFCSKCGEKIQTEFGEEKETEFYTLKGGSILCFFCWKESKESDERIIKAMRDRCK